MTMRNNNHQRLDYYAAAPAQAKALGALHSAVMQSSLPDELIELVFLRVSQINGCAYCIALHTRALAKAGVAHEKMALTAAWREAGDAFDARERAAFAFADSLTRIEATGAPDDKAIELNWSIYNAAVAELRTTRDGWRMLGFNDIAALRAAGDDSLVTFR